MRNASNRQWLLPSRPREGRLMAGVCAGIADGMHFDVTLVRLGMLLLALAWGLGVLLYLVLWFAMPDSEIGSGDRYITRFGRGVRLDMQRIGKNASRGWQEAGRHPWPRPIGRRWLAVGLIGLGILVVLWSLGAFEWIHGARAMGVAVIAVGVGVLVSLGRG